MSVAMDPRQPQQPLTRPRTRSTLSFGSHRRSHPAPQQQQQPLHHDADDNLPSSPSRHSRKESQEKAHLHAATKADPNAAMIEVQPIAAALEKPTLQSLRSFQHNDSAGNPIAEPDLSNPTRSRWERPLDTIRSFEAAIDNEYKRRHTMRVESSIDIMSAYASRRSSYYGGNDSQRYSGVGGYFNSNRQSARDSWIDNGHGMGGPVGGPPRTRYNRMQSDPQFNRYSYHGHPGSGNGINNNNVYPMQGHQQSRDTVHTHGSNGSHSDPYSTDPSSESSSVERATPVARPDLGDQYGFQGFGGPPPIMEDGVYMTQRPSKGPNVYGGPMPPMKSNGAYPQPLQQQAPPPPPHKTMPIKLTKTNSNSGPQGQQQQQPQQRPPIASNDSEKRKSWFKRRFSKS